MPKTSFEELEAALCKMSKADLENLVKRLAQWGERLEINQDQPSAITVSAIRRVMSETIRGRPFQRLRSVAEAPKKLHVYIGETGDGVWTAIAAPNLRSACRAIQVPHQFGRDNFRTLRTGIDDPDLIAKAKASPLTPFVGPGGNATAEDFVETEVEA